MKCYFDGSIGGDDDRWLTLGGFVATDAAWKDFHHNWHLMLRERYPIAPYLHMTDLLTGNEPFERRAGWKDCKVTQLINDALTVLHQVPKNELCAFACSIDTIAWRKLIAEGHPINPPAVLAAEIGIGNLFAWYRQHHGMAMAHLFYDTNEPFIRSIRTRWRQYNDPGKVTDQLFWGTIATIQPIEMRATPPMQAADMIAWATTRRLRNHPNDQWSHLADTLIGTRHHPGILTATQLDPITETIMRAKHPKP